MSHAPRNRSSRRAAYSPRQHEIAGTTRRTGQHEHFHGPHDGIAGDRRHAHSHIDGDLLTGHAHSNLDSP